MKTSRPKGQKRKAAQGRYRQSEVAIRRSSSADSSLKSLSVVAETDHWLIVDKPALLDSQNSRSDRASVVDWLNEKYGFSGLVHRLDFGTSGLMICAKNAQTAKALTDSLQKGDIN